MGYGDRLAASGVDPSQATLFIQSRVPEHAELHLLLSMITHSGGSDAFWLHDQQEKLTDKDLPLRFLRVSAVAGRRHPDLPRYLRPGR